MTRLRAPLRCWFVRSQRRRALSLLEVVLALAILAGSFATLSQLVSLSVRAAANSRDLTQAQVIAESLMSEMAAGIVSTNGSASGLTRGTAGGVSSGMTSGNMNMYPGWITQTYQQSAQHQGIIQVTVTVERDTDSWRRPRYELTRWMRDPSIEIPTEETAEESTGGSTSSSSSSSTSGTGSGTGGTGGSGTTPPQGSSGGGGAPGGTGGGGTPGGTPGGAGGGAPGGGGRR